MTVPTLNRRLMLEERVTLPDGAGGFEVTWTALGSLWADVDARAGREGVVAGQDHTRQKVRITVRAAPQGAASRPRADQRFREGARLYPILAVTESDGRGHYLMCDCETGALT
ncbi:MAG: head-tail adaptor protein [Pseudomonadota bacterium]